MNDYKVSDYGIFNDAVATTNKLNTSLGTSKETITKCQTQLNNESVFMGPACDEAINGFSSATSRISLLTENYSTIGKYLTDTAANYKSGDDSAKANILSVGSSGKVETGKSSAANFSGETTKDKLYSYLKSQGFNDAAVCGIMANVQRESGFDTTALGDGGTSYGICQWHEGRWESMKSYCSDNNLDPDSIEGQAQYLVHELKNSYPDVYDTLKNVPNTSQGAYDAAYKWTTDFEIPADKYNEGAVRGSSASSTYWEEYGSSE